MITFVLTFTLASGSTFLGGEYQSYERCQKGAQQQLEHWRRYYHRDITWTCKRRTADD